MINSLMNQKVHAYIFSLRSKCLISIIMFDEIVHLRNNTQMQKWKLALTHIHTQKKTNNNLALLKHVFI